MSTTVNVEIQGNIAVVTLNNGVTNAISPIMVEELSKIVKELKTSASGMVLTGGTKFFSMGLDLPTLLKFNRDEMGEFWTAFEQLILDLYTADYPTVCAVSGHAVAGGTIMALTSDYRFGASGSEKMGLNEVGLGVPVPLVADLMLKQAVGERAAAHMMYEGGFISMSEAREIGLVDELHLTEILTEKAVEKASAFTAFPAQAFSIIKANRTAEVARRYREQRAEQSRLFLDCWFSAEARTILEKAAANF